MHVLTTARPPFPHRWVPQSVLEASGALNKRAVGRFLKEVSASDGLSDRLSDRLSDGLSDGL